MLVWPALLLLLYVVVTQDNQLSNMEGKEAGALKDGR